MCSKDGFRTRGGRNHDGKGSPGRTRTIPGGTGIPWAISLVLAAALSSARKQADAGEPTILAPWDSRSDLTTPRRRPLPRKVSVWSRTKSQERAMDAASQAIFSESKRSGSCPSETSPPAAASAQRHGDPAVRTIPMRINFHGPPANRPRKCSTGIPRCQRQGQAG